MNSQSKNIFTAFFLVLSFVFLSVEILALNIDYVDPTPADQSILYDPEFTIKISIEEEYLNSLVYDFNGTNFTVYDENLVLMMNFNNYDELSENNSFIKDLSQYSSDGTCSGTSCPVWTNTGRYDGAFEFYGGSHISAGENSNLNNMRSLTWQAWIKCSDYNMSNIFFKPRSSDGNLAKALRVTNDNAISFYVRYSGYNLNIDSIPNTLIDGEWNHITVTWTGSDSYIGAKIYHNGIEVEYDPSSYSNPSHSIFDDAAYPFIFGQDFYGKIDEIRMWNRVLSPDEVLESYFSNLNKYDVDRWNFMNSRANLSEGTYTYQAFAESTLNDKNHTERRSIIYDTSIFYENGSLKPQISIDRIYPVGNISVYNNNFFNFTVNVSCRINDCGNINLSFLESNVGIYSGYDIVVFNQSGDYEWTVPEGITEVDVLVVGGGGGGGASYGGGGGAGGLIFQEGYDVSSSPSFQIVVGGGGNGSTSGSSVMATNGGNSSFGNLIAVGGGKGGNGASTSAAWGNGGSGGSGGGGGGHCHTYYPYVYGGSGIEGQGFAGGNGYMGSITSETSRSGGGGGGAGKSGYHYSLSPRKGGDGGAGAYFGDYFGDEYGDNGYFAAGGGGGSRNGVPSLGGIGGGGIGGGEGEPGINALPGTGSGGGAAGGVPGGNGSSGIVILRYRNPNTIPVDTGTPFYTNSTSNPLTINLDESQSELITIWINAAGEPGDYNLNAHAKKTDYPTIFNQTGPFTLTILENVASPIYEKFASDEETTNFDSIDSTSVDNPVLANNFGKVQWSASGLNLAGANLDEAVDYGYNRITVRSDIVSVLNTTANLTFRGVSYPNLEAFIILKDGVACQDCIKHSSNPVVVEVSGFSNYTTQGTGEIPEFSTIAIMIALLLVAIGVISSRKRN